jgi:hypothetical protein
MGAWAPYWAPWAWASTRSCGERRVPGVHDTVLIHIPAPHTLVAVHQESSQDDFVACSYHRRSAGTVMTEPDAVKRAHRAFLSAGADVITAASYQATVPGYMKVDCGDDAAYVPTYEHARVACGRVGACPQPPSLTSLTHLPTHSLARSLAYTLTPTLTAPYNHANAPPPPRQKGLSRERAECMVRRGVELAKEARDEFWAEYTGVYVWVCVRVGGWVGVWAAAGPCVHVLSQ